MNQGKPAQPESPMDPAVALLQVVDDETPNQEAARWAAAELIAGQHADAVISQLVDEGWEPAEAERIVEGARKQTREERGILTRDAVLRGLNVDYRRATGGLAVAFRSGLFGLYGFTTGFMAALRSFRRLKQLRESQKSDVTSTPPRHD